MKWQLVLKIFYVQKMKIQFLGIILREISFNQTYANANHDNRNMEAILMVLIFLIRETFFICQSWQCRDLDTLIVETRVFLVHRLQWKLMRCMQLKKCNKLDNFVYVLKQ